METSDTLELVTKIETEKLLVQLISQLNKDFYLSNSSIEFETALSPEVLVKQLEEVVYEFLTNKYDHYLSFIYRVDVPEKELVKIKSSNINQVVSDISYLVLKREYQKVYFKNKL